MSCLATKGGTTAGFSPASMSTTTSQSPYGWCNSTMKDTVFRHHVHHMLQKKSTTGWP